MKTTEFAGRKWYIPDWAKYITQDNDGIYVWSEKPSFGDDKFLYNGGECECLQCNRVSMLVKELE